jgi:hypothetical protein
MSAGKGQTRPIHFNDRILGLNAMGMSARDIVATFPWIYFEFNLFFLPRGVKDQREKKQNRK